MQFDMETQDPNYLKVLARFLEEQDNIFKCSSTYPWSFNVKDLDQRNRQLRRWNYDKSQSAPPELNEREDINYDMDLQGFDWRAHWKKERENK